MEKKILVITGDGGESYEVLYAKHRFQEAGYDPVIAAPSKRLLNLVMHDFEPGWDTYVERPGYKVTADITIAEAKMADYEAILLIGGRAPEYLRNDPKLRALTRAASAEDNRVPNTTAKFSASIAATTSLARTPARRRTAILRQSSSAWSAAPAGHSSRRASTAIGDGSRSRRASSWLRCSTSWRRCGRPVPGSVA